MNNHKILIGVMALAIVVLGWLWIDARNDLDNVLSRLGDDSAESRALIAEKCNPLTINDPEKRSECQDAINEYSKTIKEYQKEVAGADQN